MTDENPPEPELKPEPELEPDLPKAVEPSPVESPAVELPSRLEPSKLRGLTTLVFLVVTLGFALSLSMRSGRGSLGDDGAAPSFSGLFEGVVQDNRDGIAVVKLYGVIQTASEQGVFGMQQGSDLTVQRLKELGEKPNVKAVVLRINSPGGTVGASQEIHAQVQKLKDKGIKVVASMADVCASGGVYVAVAADKIVANKGTVTGSVGVIFSVPNFFELMEKIGVKANTIRSGKFKDIGSYSRDMTPEDKALLQGIIDSTYEQFLTAVAEGRGLDRAEVRKWADGRIFNGEQAVKYKLADQTGTFQDAVKLAQKLAGLEEAHIIKRKSNPFERFETMFQNWMNPLAAITNQLPNPHTPLLYYFSGWKGL